MRNILEIKDNFSLYKGIKSSLLWGNSNYCKSPKVSLSSCRCLTILIIFGNH